MGRQPCCDKLRVKKGPWTTEEDKKLINFILTNGHCCWRALPKLAGLRRCLLSHEEEQLVIDLHAHFGNKWSKIASRLPGRTDNEIKNHWNTHIKKRLVKMGIDPVTHQPLNQEPNNTDDNSMEPKSRSTKNVETNGSTTEDESSSTVTGQNSSMNSEKHLLSNIYNDEELFSYLWSNETTKAETPWSDGNNEVGGTLYHDSNISGAGADFPIWSPGRINGKDWTFQDYCQDFGVHDFGF
ncbi:hypothetical protein N665_0320s0084 [Sinapis alba]|nr:hypothetical protein N665_0320s0084 [Sinapis alba]